MRPRKTMHLFWGLAQFLVQVLRTLCQSACRLQLYPHLRSLFSHAPEANSTAASHQQTACHAHAQLHSAVATPLQQPCSQTQEAETFSAGSGPTTMQPASGWSSASPGCKTEHQSAAAPATEEQTQRLPGLMDLCISHAAAAAPATKART